MTDYKLAYFQLTENTLLIQWPREVSRQVLFDLVTFKAIIEKELPNCMCHGGYHELLIRWSDPSKDFPLMIQQLKRLYVQRSEVLAKRTRFYLPVCYDVSLGADLTFLCEALRISKEELIQIHTQNPYTVYAIGFLPGFMYLGGLDKRLHFPRKDQPRTKVPKGSVGIGGAQTGIYPQESPGGWQLIGQCPVPLFDVHQKPPFAAHVGDEIAFYSVNVDEYQLIQIEVETGIYALRKEVME